MEPIYIIFKDEVGKVFIVIDSYLNKYAFAGATGKITEIERTTLEREQGETGYFRALVRKRKQLENIK